MSDPNNNGLAEPIAMLKPVVEKYCTKETGLTRADVWAIAAMVGADVAKHGRASPIRFTQNWYGRVNCEDANSVCYNAAGHQVECSATAGPYRMMPSTSLNSSGVFSYFNKYFGFNEQQTVCIMGAHTVGHSLKEVRSTNGGMKESIGCI